MSLFDPDDDIDNMTYDDVPPDTQNGNSLILSAPQLMNHCIGHEEQEELFLSYFNNDALPHALIFSGIKGIGKSTMAFRLARFLIKHGARAAVQGMGLFGDETPPEAQSLDVDDNDPVFSRVASGAHPDLLYVHRTYDSTKGREDAHLKVDALRKIEPFLRRTSSDGGWRVVIVDDADTMNRNAQNAILKIVEEPPARVLIILITHRLGCLIPTIKSRTRVIRFNPLSHDNIQHLLHSHTHTLTSGDMDIALSLSSGSVGDSLRYIEQNAPEILHKIIDCLSDAPSWDWSKIHKLSAALSPVSQDKEYRIFCEILPRIFGDLASLKARHNDNLPPYLHNNVMRCLFEGYDMVALLTIHDDLIALFSRTDHANLDRRDAIRAAFLMISQ